MIIKLARIFPGDIVDFDCDDADLKDYFTTDWIAHESELFAITYGLFYDEECVAMFSVANDRVDSKEMGRDEAAREEALAALPDSKRNYRHYPAVKIARLAVATNWRKQGIGSFILIIMKAFFLVMNKTGCRYMTVDAYNTAAPFYEKKGEFQAFPRRSGGNGNTAMYYDLLLLKDAFDKNPAIRALYEGPIRDFVPNGYVMIFSEAAAPVEALP